MSIMSPCSVVDSKKKTTDGGVIIRQVLSDVAQFAVKKALI